MKNKKMIIASTLAFAIVVSGGLALTSKANAAEDATATSTLAATDAKDKGFGRGYGIGGVDRDELAALLGLTTDELKAAQKEDKTLATIATENGVAVQKVIDLVAASIVEKLDKQLADGKITQEQYDTRKAEAATKAADSVNSTFEDRGGRGGRGGPGGHIGGGVDPEELAALLGLSTEELRKVQKEGKTLAAIATEKGVTVQKVVDLVAASINEKLATQLADGKITQAEFDTRTAEVATKAKGIVDGTIKTGGHGGKGGHGGAFGGVSSEELATLLGLTTDELRTEQKAGKTLAAIATEKGVTVQKVVDLVAASINEKLAKQLADGQITQAEFDTRTAEVAAKAQGIVDGTIKTGGHGGKGGKGGPRGQADSDAAADETASS